MPIFSKPGFDRIFAQNRDQKNHDENKRDRIEHIDEAHHDVVDAAAEIAGDGAVRDADHERNQRGYEADDQRNACAPKQPCEQIAA